MRGRRPFRSRGFTLVELLIAMTMSGLVVSALMTFFVVHVKSARRAGIRIEAVQRARFAAEILRREIALAGAGIPDAQPLAVFAGPSDFLFSVDLASSTPGDRVAVYQLPDAPASETEGADSAAMSLPNGQPYPRAWYGPDRTPGPAETVRFSFVPQGDDEFALVRAVNGQSADTLLRGLKKIGPRDFFTYWVAEADGRLRELTADTVWHSAPVHESAADTAGSALADSIKLVEIAFTVKVPGRRFEEPVERNISMGVALKNAGLIRNPACGDRPALGVAPDAELTATSPPRVTISWPPALDENAGELDVQQYTLYRREAGALVPRPIASLPPAPGAPGYSYVDTDVEPGRTYIYYLGATDCTPAQSDLAQSPAVTVPGA
jgi:prepilin-type N-terminal cleavage/methylation domain-containing protein